MGGIVRFIILLWVRDIPVGRFGHLSKMEIGKQEDKKWGKAKNIDDLTVFSAPLSKAQSYAGHFLWRHHRWGHSRQCRCWQCHHRQCHHRQRNHAIAGSTIVGNGIVDGVIVGGTRQQQMLVVTS